MKKRFVLSIGLCLLVMLFGINSYIAADEAADKQQEIFRAKNSGVVLFIPDEFQSIKGTIEYEDYGDRYARGEGIVEMDAFYYPMSKEKLDSMREEMDRADRDGDISTVGKILIQMNNQELFQIYGINDGRGTHELIQFFMSGLDPENTRQTGYTLTEKEIEAKKEWILSRHYIEIGEYEGFTYILVTEDPESLKNAESSTGLEEEYLEEYIALLERAALLKKDIRLTGGVELRNPVVLAEEGSRIKFQAMDLDGNPAKSENLFAGHSLTMINLWATWCNPCIRELPELEKINQEYANKNCQVIGIVTDADNAELISKAKDILAEKGVTYINLAAFEGLSDLLPQEGWPTSYFVDEKGCLVGEPVAGARPNQYRERMEKSGEASD